MSRLSAAVLTLTGLLLAPLAAAQTPPAAPTVAPAPAAAAPSTAPQTPAVPARQARPTQQPPTPPGTAPTPKPAAAPAPARSMTLDPAQQVNVRVELSISEAPGAGAKKTVTLMTTGGRRGSIRSTLSAQNMNMRLSVDASPLVMKDGRILLDLIFDYTPDQTQAPSNSIANLNEQMTVSLTDGKPMLVSQSADPKGDRKVTVEVTATVVK